MNDDPWSVDYTGPHSEEPDQKSLDEYWDKVNEDDYWDLRYGEMGSSGGSLRQPTPIRRKMKWRHVWHGDGTWSITQEPVDDEGKNSGEPKKSYQKSLPHLSKAPKCTKMEA